MSAEIWHRPLWYCADCAGGYEGSSDDEDEVERDAAEHNRFNHEDG